MTDWAIVSPPSEGLPGQAQRVRDYTLTPGSTQVYNEGDIHSPRRRGPTRLLRIEGIPLCRENPKIGRVYDAEVVSDQIAEHRPVFRYLLAQEM